MSETSGEARAAIDPAEAAPDGGTATTTVDPTPPEEFIEAAKLAPDHWLYLIDPTWSDEGPPPEWAVVGQWRSDAEGEIVEWQDNEDYRPSPSAMGWPEPADDVDAAIQLATTGYGPADDVTKALAKAEVAVLVTADGDPVRAAAPDSTPVVLVYSSPKYLHLAGRLAFETTRVPEFLERIPEGHSLCINSSGPVSMVMTTDGLADIMKAAEEAPEGDGAPSGSAAGSVWPPTMSTEGASWQEASGQEANQPEVNEPEVNGSANGVVKGAVKRGRSRAAEADGSSRLEDVLLPEPEQASAPEPGDGSAPDSGTENGR